MHLVRNYNDGLPVISHGAQDPEQLIRLLRRQHRCRLIQDQDVRAAVEDLDDLHRLLLGNGHVIDLFLRIDLKSVRVTNLFDPGGGGIQIQLALFPQAQHDVLGSRHHINKFKMLMDHADPVIKSLSG